MKMNAKDYLKQYILCKGQTIDENGEVIGGTLAGKENVKNKIDSMAPYLEDYARLYHESEVKKLHKHCVIKSVCPNCRSSSYSETNNERRCKICHKVF